MKYIFVLSMLCLGACDGADAYVDAESWAPSGANAQNLATMVANPHDLVFGRNASRGDARQAAEAVNRVWLDRPKPLLSAAGSAGGGSAGAGAAGSN